MEEWKNEESAIHAQALEIRSKERERREKLPLKNSKNARERETDNPTDRMTVRAKKVREASAEQTHVKSVLHACA